MKHKFLSLFIAIVAMTILNSPTSAAVVTINGIAYELNGTTATVVSGENYTGTIVIPASVTYNEVVYSVTSIGNWVFRDCSGLTSVTIPNSVTSIGGSAFYGCTGLTSVHISDIAAWCAISFGNNSANPLSYAHNLYLNGELVTDLVIPNSVTSIGGSAFSGCGLTSVTIPNSVTSIGGSAFYGCGLTSVTIPNSVTSIGGSAFESCTSLTSVTIPNSVTSIGTWAFYGCTGLTSVTIPNSVTSIGDRTFCGCTGLTSVTIPNSVTSIGRNAFHGCSSLTSVTIPNSVTSIGERAFFQCGSLTSVTIPNSVTSIGERAFSQCGSLTSVTIEAETPPTLGENAFYNTNSPIYVPCGTLDAYKTAWTDYASRISYAPLPYKISTQAVYGSVGITSLENYTICDEQPYHYTLTVTANYGYHFTQWSDGNTDNPRTIELTQDTTLEAEFAKNTYTISTTSANPEWGTTAGGSALYLDEVEISATPNYGYHFVQWSDREYICDDWWDGVCYWGHWGDYNTEPTRTIVVERDSIFTATFAKNVYSIAKIAEHEYISGNSSAEYLDEVTLSVSSDYGYHFAQWSDGNTDNPRTIVLTQDTTFTAEFAKNAYTISITSANPEWGTTAGGKSALYQDEVEISATPNYGYHFVQWSDREYICDDWWDGVCYYGHWGDYNTEPTRTIVVERDSVITATFAKNVYTITKNSEHGTISGNSSAEYLDYVTLTAVPDYGYHFTQWSDGLKDNPRIFQITSDTTFTAEFAYDRVGMCGKDLALVWSYDPVNKVLTIGNAGEFTENMQFGAEAPAEMEELVIGNNVTAIGENAFAGISTLKKVTIGESVKTIHNNAFYNCVNLETIFNYRSTPTNAYSTAFDGVDKFECILYVLPNSIDMYKNASVWRDFYYTYAIGAEEATVTTNDVQVEPQDNAATLTWPTSNNAVSYTIEITKDGVVFCRLTFNANGQLTGIAFAPGRGGQSMAPAALMTANGLQFTVTGLNSNTQYGYSLTAKDANEQPIATYSGSFTTTSEGVPTGIDNTPFLSGEGRGEASKLLRNGEVLILRDGKTYTIQGVEVK